MIAITRVNLLINLIFMKEESKDIDISFKNHGSEEPKEKKKEAPVLQENPFFSPKEEEPAISTPVIIQPAEIAPDYCNQRKKIESSPNFMLNKKRVGKPPAGPLSLFGSTKNHEGTPIFKADHITEIRTVNVNMIINNASRSPAKQGVSNEQAPQHMHSNEIMDAKSNHSYKAKCCSLEKENGSICKCLIF